MLKQHLRLPRDVPHICLLHELGLQPFVHTYVLAAVKLYNNLLAGGQVYSALLRQQVNDALVSRARVRNWVYHLHRVLCLVDHRGRWQQRLAPQNGTHPTPIAIAPLKKSLREAYVHHIAKYQRVYKGLGSCIGHYFREVATHGLGCRPAYLSRRLPYGQVLACVHMRLGAHSLHVRRGRFARTPQRLRTCQRCMPLVPVVDDMRHCLFRCQHHRLLAHRQQFIAVVPEAAAASTLADIFTIVGQSAGKLRAAVRFVADCRNAVHAALFEDEEEELVLVTEDVCEDEEEELIVVTEPEEERSVQFVFDGVHDWLPPELYSD